MSDYSEDTVERPMTAEDVEVTVRTDKQFEREETGRDRFFSEGEYGAFQRAFRLSRDAARDKIDAEFKDGALGLISPNRKRRRLPLRKVSNWQT